MENILYKGKDFSLTRIITPESAKSEYKLHNHEGLCEILFFLGGNSSFLVEGTEYPLSKNDFIIARPDEMHRVIHKGDCLYERIVINFNADFFEKFSCTEYSPAFFSRPAGSGNLFSAHTSPRACESLWRLYEYVEENAPEIVLVGGLAEVLRAVSKNAPNSSEGHVKSERLREIILFINENLTDDITLDSLCEKFFITKWHLCRLFKAQTGMTPMNYITKKRLMLSQTFMAQGMSMTDAALGSGFRDYASFWYAKKNKS